MPRLAGKSSDTATKGVTAIAVILVAVALALELIGTIDLVPRFGRTSESVSEEIHQLGGIDV